MSSKIRPLSILLAIFMLAAAAPAHAAKSVDEERAEVRKMRDDVLNEFYEQRPELKKRVRDAVGYAVFSNVGVNIIFASFGAGHGIVVTHGMFKEKETYMKMGAAGIGLGLGVKDFRALFIFNDRNKLEAFISKGWEFNGQADAAAKSDDKGGAAAGSGTFLAGVEVYQLTKNGLVLQATLQGTKYWKDDKLNQPPLTATQSNS